MQRFEHVLIFVPENIQMFNVHVLQHKETFAPDIIRILQDFVKEHQQVQSNQVQKKIQQLKFSDGFEKGLDFWDSGDRVQDPVFQSWLKIKPIFTALMPFPAFQDFIAGVM